MIQHSAISQQHREKKLKNMVDYYFYLFFFPFVAGFYNVQRGNCYSYSFADTFRINETSFAQLDVLESAEKRSFVECCLMCDFGEGCSGVAYKAGECSILNATVTGEEEEEDGEYQVMMYHTTPTNQVC